MHAWLRIRAAEAGPGFGLVNGHACRLMNGLGRLLFRCGRRLRVGGGGAEAVVRGAPDGVGYQHRRDVQSDLVGCQTIATSGACVDRSLLGGRRQGHELVGNGGRRLLARLEPSLLGGGSLGLELPVFGQRLRVVVAAAVVVRPRIRRCEGQAQAARQLLRHIATRARVARRVVCVQVVAAHGGVLAALAPAVLARHVRVLGQGEVIVRALAVARFGDLPGPHWHENSIEFSAHNTRLNPFRPPP